METIGEKVSRRIELASKIEEKLGSYLKENIYLAMKYRENWVEHPCCGINYFFNDLEEYRKDSKLKGSGYILNGKERMMCQLVEDFNEEQLNEILKEIDVCIGHRAEIETALDEFYLYGAEYGSPRY